MSALHVIRAARAEFGTARIVADVLAIGLVAAVLAALWVATP